MTDKKQVIKDTGTGHQAENMTVNYNYHQIKNKSVIAKVVNAIANSNFEIELQSTNSVALPARVQEKIAHNNVKKCQYIIESIKTNNIDLTNVYDVLEQEKPRQIDKILCQIQFLYKAELGSISQDENLSHELIQKHADKIIENIQAKLRSLVLESENLDADNEDVDLSVQLIVADAFIKCLILENPESTT